MKKPQVKSSNFVVLVSFFVTLLLLIGCKTPSNTMDTPVQDTIDFEIISENTYSSFTDKESKLLETQAELEEVMNTINANISPKILFPEIDLSKYQIGFASMGELPTGGSTITVASIVKTENKVIVYLGGVSPNAGDIVTTAITSPYTLFFFEKQELPVVFKYTSEK